MKISEIITALEEFAPLALQLEWDNSGKQVGDFESEAKGAVLTLDITEQSLETAKKLGANLIISHHPLIFSGLKSITGANTTEKIVIEAIRSGIAIYSCHTNIDAAMGGVSWAMAEKLGLKNIVPLTESGIGCVGELEEDMSLNDFIRFVKNRYNIPCIKTNPIAPQTIKRVVVMGGSGASEIEEAVAAGADAMVTGDLKYHDFQRGYDKISLVDIGHFESEIEVLGIFLDVIQKKYPTFALHTEKISFAEIR